MDDAVARALASGYQVDVGAFELLVSVEKRVNVVDTIDKIVQIKKLDGGGGLTTISRSDVDALLAPEESAGDLKDLDGFPDTAEENLEIDFEIINDLTEKLFPVEGTDGFRLLFQ